MHPQLCSASSGLDLIEISHKSWVGKEIKTYIDGAKPIDGVCVSESLELGGFKILSIVEGVGNHRTVVFDVESRGSLVGADELRVVCQPCRRLNTKTSNSLGGYTKILGHLMTQHRMEVRLDNLIHEIQDDTPTPAQRQKMEVLDKQMVELQTCAEKRCRKIIKPCMDFSPKVELWHERLQAYKMLMCRKRGQ